ncbi:Exonuclease SbcC [Streptomyces misionensis JCM 4497]
MRVSGAWCVQMQGGGGSRRDGGAPARAKPSVGESASDDNAADVRAGPRDPDKIRKTGPSRGRAPGSGRPGAGRTPRPTLSRRLPPQHSLFRGPVCSARPRGAGHPAGVPRAAPGETMHGGTVGRPPARPTAGRHEESRCPMP